MIFDLKWAQSPKIPLLPVLTVIFVLYYFCPSAVPFTFWKSEL